MKKILIILIFIFPYFISVKSQNIYNQIKGTWIVDSIVNFKKKSQALSKFSNKGEFLKFKFKNKTSLFVSNAPFDEGIFVPIKIIKDEINVIPENVFISNGQRFYREGTLPVISESQYEIFNINENTIELKTTNINKDTILYYLSRQVIIEQDTMSFSFLLNVCLLNKITIYNFKMGENRYCTPEYKLYSSLINDLIFKLNLIKFIPKDELSKKIIVKITVNKRGRVSNPIIIKGINKSLDESVLHFFEKTKWEMPSSINYCNMIFSINFINEDCKNI